MLNTNASLVQQNRTLHATVTSKGQITLPIELRRRLNIEAGTSISFEVNETSAVLMPELPTRAYRGFLRQLQGLDTSIPKEVDRF
jgi:AbrB family looped-hinge helix DNA binding protein